MNRFIKLQNTLRDLLAAHPYFAAAPVLTEQLADLDAQIERQILQAGGFGLVITTARGQRHGDDELAPLLLNEELTIAIIHSPLMDPKHTALDALDAAITAIESANALILCDTGAMPWRILGHDYREDAPEGIVTHHLRVSTLI